MSVVGIDTHRVRTFARNTAGALAPLLPAPWVTPCPVNLVAIGPHSQSPGLAIGQGEVSPRVPVDLPRFVTDIKLVVRSLDCLPVWDVTCMVVPTHQWVLLFAPLEAKSLFPDAPRRRSFQSVEHGSPDLPSPLGGPSTPRDLSHSLFAIRLICPRRSLDPLSDTRAGP